MKSKSLTAGHYRCLERSLEKQIAHLEQAKQQLGRIDSEIYRTGRELFTTDGALLEWLCSPAPALGGRIPLTVMRSRQGREKVCNILKAIGHGVLL